MIIIIMYLSLKKYIDRFTDNTDSIINSAINDTFKADLASIVNLGNILNELNTPGKDADLSQINNTKINDLMVSNMNCDNLFINGNIEITDINNFSKFFNIYPRYMIMIWTLKDIPKGWAVCNGATWYVNYETESFSLNDDDNSSVVVVPDLRDRFVIGATDEMNSIYSLNKTGGQNSITLNNSNIPSHNHTTPFLIHKDKIPKNAQSISFLSGYFKGSSYTSTLHHKGQVESRDDGTSYGYILYKEDGPIFDFGYPIYTDYARDNPTSAGTPSDKSKPHENRPPYYKLYYIMKL